MILDKICEYYKNSTESWANLFDANRVECFRFFTDLSLHDKVISDALCFKSGENILDAGCGVGEPGVSFAKLFPDTNFYLVNISKYQLSKIDSTLDNVYLINSDFHSLNFSDEFFDKIYFLESFSHSLFKRKLIKEVYRVLKPGGILLNLDFCRKENTDNNKVKIHRKVYSHYPVYSKLLRSLFKSEGFYEVFFYENLKNNIILNDKYDKEKYYCYDKTGNISDFGKVHMPIYEHNAHVQKPCFMLYRK